MSHLYTKPLSPTPFPCLKQKSYCNSIKGLIFQVKKALLQKNHNLNVKFSKGPGAISKHKSED
eukprot:UN15945